MEMAKFVPLLAGFGPWAVFCGPLYTIATWEKYAKNIDNCSQSSLSYIDKEWMLVTCLILIVL